MNDQFLAHVRQKPSGGWEEHGLDPDENKQSLKKHLEGVAALSEGFASKIDLGKAGELIGLLHDLGKYSQEFQNYFKSAVGLLNPDEDEEFVDAKGLRGKVDHSTAGAQLVWKELSKQGQLGQVVGQILALCIASHHSGLIDCLTSSPTEPVTDGFTRRMGKSEEKAHLEEVQPKADTAILNRFQGILADKELIQSLKNSIHRIVQQAPDRHDTDPSKSTVAQFQIGLLVRFLFSCLIDGDRIDTADFEKPRAAQHRMRGRYTGWEELIKRLELHLSRFASRYDIDKLRNQISSHCLEAAARKKGIYTLTVPTGGGKTLASLRFALHHARAYGMDRIVYVIPFTSIIDQNADVVREILEPGSHPGDQGRIVLEHHSNLGPEMQGWKQKILTENWDAPVIYTTSVQFLETVFGSGTRSARRLHQLANAVIIFDEIQSLPVKCVHLFSNAVNFLTDQCGSTVVLCTATQPLLDKVDSKKGAIRLAADAEIMPDVHGLFEKLKRVDVKDNRRPGGWDEESVAELALKELKSSGSCLIIVNTKKAARGLYRRLEEHEGSSLYHLSTSMCPVHRREILSKIKGHRGRNENALCVSTQLIEAGVDVDFGSVIRFMAGLDSIAQAAGRCNRNGSRTIGTVHVINPADENLNSLEDIRIGRDKAERVLDDFQLNPGGYDNNILGPKAMAWYYENYFYDRKGEMGYPVSGDLVGRSDTLLNLLSVNSMAVADYMRSQSAPPVNFLRQSFMAAAKAFRVIDAPTQGVIVQYGKEGARLVAELCAAYEVEKQFELLRRAQQFTVNIFPNEFQKLLKLDALHEVQQGTEIYYLDKRYYSKDFGLSTEPVSEQELLYV